MVLLNKGDGGQFRNRLRLASEADQGVSNGPGGGSGRQSVAVILQSQRSVRSSIAETSGSCGPVKRHFTRRFIRCQSIVVTPTDTLSSKHGRANRFVGTWRVGIPTHPRLFGESALRLEKSGSTSRSPALISLSGPVRLWSGIAAGGARSKCRWTFSWSTTTSSSW